MKRRFISLTAIMLSFASLLALAPAASAAEGGFRRGLVTLAFDDGWSNQYSEALPLLSKYGQPATFYVMSGELTNQPAYMTADQLRAVQAAGHEIASHTITHSDLTTLPYAQLEEELVASRQALEATVGRAVTNFAYPYGAYNATTVAAASKYYGSQRTVDAGYNTKSGFNANTLKVQNVFGSTTPAEVQSWVNQAMTDGSWLILVYHEIGVTPIDPSDYTYLTHPSDLDAELSYLKTSEVPVVTVTQALAEIAPQL